MLGRTTDRNGPLFRADEFLLLQRVQVLPHRHRRYLQPRGEGRRVHRAFRFQQLDDTPARFGFGDIRWHVLFLKQLLYKVNCAGVDSDLVKEMLYK